MFGVFQFALVVLFAVCSTQASPLRWKQRSTGPPLVIKEDHQCEQKTKLNDNVEVSMATFTEIGIQSSPFRQEEFKLGESIKPEGFDEALLDMCPGEIRRLIYSMNRGLGTNDPYFIYVVQLISIKPATDVPPEMDANGDNVVTRDELAEFLRQTIAEFFPVGSPLYEQTMDETFLEIDTNQDGFLDSEELLSLV